MKSSSWDVDRLWDTGRRWSRFLGEGCLWRGDSRANVPDRESARLQERLIGDGLNRMLLSRSLVMYLIHRQQ